MKVAWHEVPGIDPMMSPSRRVRYDLVPSDQLPYLRRPYTTHECYVLGR